MSGPGLVSDTHVTDSIIVRGAVGPIDIAGTAWRLAVGFVAPDAESAGRDHERS